MDTERLAEIEGNIRPAAVKFLPNWVLVKAYSESRTKFLDRFVEDLPDERVEPPEELSRELWGIEFGSPLMNAAGMFKDGGGYEVVARQGAGAYLAGTATPVPRDGNRKKGINTPFVPLPESEAALNWLGLPNHGYEHMAEEISQIDSYYGCPVGVSLMGDPEVDEDLETLVDGIHLMADSGADFIEINESCTNTEEELPQDSGLSDRLEYIAENYLEARSPQEAVPLVVKFSNDTPLGQVPDLVDLLIDSGYHGVNFGNTSTEYEEHRDGITDSEVSAYEYFMENFGGGLSGEPLNEISLALATEAQDRAEERNPSYEFHVIRTGGVSEPGDIRESEEAGISMNQWYTGYSDRFLEDGHKVYASTFNELMENIS